MASSTGQSPPFCSNVSLKQTPTSSDRNRHKLICFDKANADGIQHAQLPISAFLPEMTTRKVLTVNQVFEIMLKWIETRDWKDALRQVMPTRKYVDGPRVRGGGRKNVEGEDGSGVEEGDEEGDEGDEGDEDAMDESMEVLPDSAVEKSTKETVEAEAGPSESSAV